MSEHGTELFRYFSTSVGEIISVWSDGTILVRHKGGWKVWRYKPNEITLEDWAESQGKIYESLPEWQRQCKTAPDPIRHRKPEDNPLLDWLWMRLDSVQLNKGLKITSDNPNKLRHEIKAFSQKNDKLFRMVRGKVERTFIVQRIK
jgi:hypothetical protein